MDNKQLVSLTAPVVHVATDERSRNWDLEKNSSLINKRVQIISEDDLPTIINSNKYSLPKRIYAGDILVEDPFESKKYILLNGDVEYKLRYKKYCKIKEIAQKLGAKSCDIIEATMSEEERIWEVDGNIRVKVINSNINIKSDEKLATNMGIHMHNDYEGSPIVSLKSIQEAKELVDKYNLDEEESIKSLINMRDPSQEYRVFNDHYHFSMSREYDSLLDIAFSLNAINFDIDANVKKTMSKKESIDIDIKFDFPSEILQQEIIQLL